jgi:hypothetical protein
VTLQRDAEALKGHLENVNAGRKLAPMFQRPVVSQSCDRTRPEPFSVVSFELPDFPSVDHIPRSSPETAGTDESSEVMEPPTRPEGVQRVCIMGEGTVRSVALRAVNASRGHQEGQGALQEVVEVEAEDQRVQELRAVLLGRPGDGGPEISQLPTLVMEGVEGSPRRDSEEVGEAPLALVPSFNVMALRLSSGDIPGRWSWGWPVNLA